MVNLGKTPYDDQIKSVDTETMENAPNKWSGTETTTNGFSAPTPQKVSEPTNSIMVNNSIGREVTEADLKEVAEARKRLNIGDVNSIVTFGAESQAPLAKLSDSMLDSVKARDTGDVADQLTTMVTSMKSINLDALGNEKKQGFISKLLGRVNPIEKFQERFDSVSTVVDRAVTNLSQYAADVMRDNIFLDRQREASFGALHKLNIDILAIDQTMNEFQDYVEHLKAIYAKSNDIIDAQNVNDANETLDRLDRRRNDLLLTRQVVATLNVKNNIIKSANVNLLEKIQNQIVNGIPLWKSEISQRIMNGTRAGATAALKASTDFTNELFKKSAQELRATNRAIREETNRGIIDVDTIRVMTENLINTMNDTIEITQQGKIARENTEKDLIECSSKLKNALTENIHKAAQVTMDKSGKPQSVFQNYNKQTGMFNEHDTTSIDVHPQFKVENKET